jgi:hypothetical protein
LISILLFLLHHDLDDPWKVDTTPNNQYGQTVVLYYGLRFMCNKLPKPNLNHLQHPDEVKKVKWISIEKVCEKTWAFEHDKVFDEYYKRICGVK